MLKTDTRRSTTTFLERDLLPFGTYETAGCSAIYPLASRPVQSFEQRSCLRYVLTEVPQRWREADLLASNEPYGRKPTQPRPCGSNLESSLFSVHSQVCSGPLIAGLSQVCFVRAGVMVLFDFMAS